MEYKNDLIPEQKTGAQTNTESEIEFATTEEATAFFNKVKDRLLHVNGWQQLAGSPSASFQLMDAEGKEVDRAARKGDYFKIDIPGPENGSGAGYDWVRIEEVGETENELTLLVRPCPNPFENNEEISHFFSPEATSSFKVSREKNTVAAGVYGRNEKPNTDTEKTIDKIRNATVAAGAISGFSKLQWKRLTDGLVRKA
jgi:hypothetical protein